MFCNCVLKWKFTMLCLSLYNLGTSFMINGRFASTPVITEAIMAVLNVLILLYVFIDYRNKKNELHKFTK